MRAQIIRRAPEFVDLLRLAAAVATRWCAEGMLRDRDFSVLSAVDPALSAPERPTVPLARAA